MRGAMDQFDPMLSPPRIAFISSLGFGGSTTFVCNLAGELMRRNVPVLVVSPEKENDFATDFQIARVNVVLHDQRQMIFEDRMQAMLKALAEFRPTVVISCLGATSYEVLRYLPAGVNRMALIHTDAPMFYDAVSPYTGCMDAVVGISTRITEQLAAMSGFVNVAKFCLLHGVKIPPVAERRETDERPLRILYFGRIMNPQKRVYLFPKILADLKQAGIPFQWRIVGEGNQRGELERQMVSENPRQQVTFSGSVPNAQVAAILDQHDIFLLASDAEGLPISLLEAMAHGVVPVVSDLASGIREVVDASNGMLVPVQDLSGYARAIVHLHEHRDELAAKSAAARVRVQSNFSVAAMTDRWLAAFPAPPAAPPIWPSRWKITAPLTSKNPVQFSRPCRFLRRLARQLHAFWKCA